MGYSLGKKSLQELAGVHSDLVALVYYAISICEQDFSVHDGLRTQEEQAALVKSGASKTMDSRHLTGHAVDLVPYMNGKLRWEWPLIYPIAEAMRTAAKKASISLTWGGCWDVDFTASTDPCEKLVAEYVERRRKLGKKAFIDGPHFELSRKVYP